MSCLGGVEKNSRVQEVFFFRVYCVFEFDGWIVVVEGVNEFDKLCGWCVSICRKCHLGHGGRPLAGGGIW